MRSDDSFLLGLRKHTHHALVALGPIAFREAVHQEDVDVINAKLFAEAVEVSPHSGRVPRPGFREHGGFVSRHVLQGFCHVGMTSVRIGGVKKMQTVVVAIQQHVGKALDSEGGLMRVMADANGTSTHGEPAGVDTRVAEHNGVGGGELFCQFGRGPGVAAEFCSEPGSSDSVGGGGYEFAAFHLTSFADSV